MKIDLVSWTNCAHRENENDVFKWSAYVYVHRGDKQNKNVSGLRCIYIRERERERERELN